MTDGTDSDKYKFFLHDFGPIALKRALEAKAEKHAAPKNSREYEFEAGRLMAFNEIISILQQQAEGFGIPLKELRIEGVDPDRDLV